MNTTPNDLSTFYSGRHLQTVITSYGENHADTPTGNALHVDTRILRNPPEDPAVRARMMESNGLDPDVRHYVMSTPGARHLVDQAVTKARFLLTPENLHQWAAPRPSASTSTSCAGEDATDQLQWPRRSPSASEQQASALKSSTPTSTGPSPRSRSRGSSSPDKPPPMRHD